MPPWDWATERTIARPSPEPLPPSRAAADEALEHAVGQLRRDARARVLDTISTAVAVAGLGGRVHRVPGGV